MRRHTRLDAPSLMQDLSYCIIKRSIARMLKSLIYVVRLRVKKDKHTTDSNHQLPITPNLLDQQFTDTQPNKACVTYIQTKASSQYCKT